MFKCLAFLCAAVVHASVIGIDFGTEFFKVSLISPGKSFVIIENTTTKRKTENAVAFYNNERLYESDGASKKTKSPKNTFLYLNKFIGALQTDESVVEISKSLYEDFLISFDERRDTFVFTVADFQFDGKESITLNVEQLTGMVFKYILRLIKSTHNVEVKDCVITVPSAWGIGQRTVLKSAAAIADLEVLAIMNENSAAALYYGLERSDNNTHTALFVNLGAYNLQVTLVDYLAINATKKLVETIRVISDYSVAYQGGLVYDQALATYFGKQFDAQPSREGKKSIFTNPRAFQKLMKASNKYKEMLSANKDAPVYIEGLIDGEDFNYAITRQVFEQLIQPITDKIVEAIEYTLAKGNRNKNEINVVELIGGGIRVPKVQATLADYFGDIEVGTHLNGDESMAFGAAFHAANLSHSFKVRPIHFYDGFSFAMSVEIKGEDGYYKEFQLFPYKKNYGSKRSFEFYYDKNLQLDVSIIKDDIKTPYLTYYLNNITDAVNLNHSKPEISLTFKISSNEFLKLEQAELKVEETKLVEIEQPKEEKKEEEKKEEIKEETKEDKESTEEIPENPETPETPENTKTPENPETPENTENPETPENTNENNDKPESEESTGESTEPIFEESEEPIPAEENGELEDTHEEPPKETEESGFDTIETVTETVVPEKSIPKFKKVKVAHTFAIDYTVNNYLVEGLNKTEIEESKKIMVKFEEIEEATRKLSEVKNKLESYIYMLRDAKDSQSFIKASVESERDAIFKLSEEYHEYLESDDAYTATYDTFNGKLTTLENLMRPISVRLEQHRLRPQAVNETIQKITEFSKKAQNLNTTMPWVPEEKKVKLYGTLTNSTNWIKEKFEEQNTKELHEDPVFLVEDLKKHVDLISREYTKIKNIPKPRKTKEQKEEEQKKKEQEKSEKQQQKQQFSEDSNTKQDSHDEEDL